MEHWTEEEYQQKLANAEEDRRQKEYRAGIRKAKGVQKMETHKVLAIYLFLLLNAIIIYAMIAMWRFGDLSYLGVLITDIAAQIVTYAIYCVKAFKGKQAEEDIKLKREKMHMEDPEWE